MSRIAWITGAGGLIGSNIAQVAPKSSPWEVHPLTRGQLDLCDFAAVTKAFLADRPALVIHCAAISQSPACEASPDLARRLNLHATEHLAQLAADVQFIFFSTDLVFDGTTGNYNESATPAPLSVYGKTKVAAEHSVLRNPRHTVIRTSLTAGSSPTGDRSLNEQLHLAWQRGQKTRLFTDEYRCPIGASVTASVVWQLAEEQCSGLFHLAGSQRLSRWQIGQAIAARYPNLAPQLEPASLAEYRGSPRAPDTSLDCTKIQQALALRLPGFEEWLARRDGAAPPLARGQQPM